MVSPLKIIRDKPKPEKLAKEICHDANDVFSESPNSKQESRMFTPAELKEKGRPHKGKYR